MQDIDLESDVVDVVLERDSVRVDIGIDLQTIVGFPVVCGVVPASPADTAGILVGDVILSVNGKTIVDGAFAAVAGTDATLRLGVKQVNKKELELLTRERFSR